MNLALAGKSVADSSRLDVMNFLNEIAGSYPSAISFASGRPAEAFFNIQEWIERLPVFVHHFARQKETSFESAFNILAQYGRTNGIIGDLIAEQLRFDEGISCNAAQVLVTVGCQEAIDLCVTHLCPGPDDVVLVRSPTYIGITGVADLNGIEISSFSCNDDGGIAQALRQAAHAVEVRGKHPRVLYLVPDFDNPTGTVLSRTTREEIIAFCAEKGIVILEDNPYGMFRFEGEKIPTMYALDTKGCVIYLGTYSKTICPSLRVGFAVVPAHLSRDNSSGGDMLDQLSRAKSFVTVNTSQIGQAIVGAVLLTEEGSLGRLIGPAVNFYRDNRDAMLASLETSFEGWEEKVKWNTPQGGFFLTVTLPFAFRRAEAETCARDYGVLTMPLSFFALDDGQDNCVRLAYSNTEPSNIRKGIDRFSRFVIKRLKEK